MAKRKYGKSLGEFKSLIIKHPFLALESKIARDIKKEIEAKKLPVDTVSGDFYRCRKVKNDKVFDSKDLMFAPVGIPKEGRFNHSGQSHLYLSKEKETAKAEIIGEVAGSHLVWVQKVNIEKPIDNILDLTFDWTCMTISTNALLVALHAGGHILCTKDNKDNWRPDYLITRFIMDCAKNAGYNGIKYASARHYIGDNIVLFKNFSDKITAIASPIIDTFKDDFFDESTTNSKINNSFDSALFESLEDFFYIKQKTAAGLTGSRFLFTTLFLVQAFPFFRICRRGQWWQ